MLCVIFTVLLLSADIARGRIILVENKVSPQILDGLTIHKVIHTWEEADLHYKAQGAVLASPITTELLDAMRALIAINNTPYFIGTRSSDFFAPFTSLEGVLLDNITATVTQMIQQLDPRDGDCLSMDQHSIRVVPCCARLPYLCYKAQVGNINSTTIYSDLNNATQGVNLSPESTITESTENDNDKTGNSNITYGIDVRFGPDYSTPTKSQEDTMMFDLNNTVPNIPKDDCVFSSSSRPDYVMEVAQDKPKTPCGTYDEGKRLDEIYNIWHYGQPTDIDMPCGVIYPSGLLDNLFCDVAKKFICEKEL